MTTIEAIQLAANFCIVPLLNVLWGINSRLSKIEGYIHMIELQRVQGDE